MILPDMLVPVPRPPEREVMDEIAAQEDGEHECLELSVGRIRDHACVVMSSGVVVRGSGEWQHLEEVLKEVHNGKVYRCREAIEGGRGVGGSRGGRGGTSVVMKS
jgi:hypothetical protein